MTDNNDDFGIAAEAEKILKAAAEEIRAEQCPRGDKCGIHFRVDDEIIDNEEQFARFITYVNDYVVVTEDNHVLDDPRFLINLLMGLITKENAPNRFETSIYHVGEGTIWNLAEDNDRTIREGALRYSHSHNDWEGVSAEHNSVVVMLREGMIDVSQPIEEQEW